MDPSAIAITGSIAWAALWVSVVIVPYNSKSETLHKEYVGSGAIDLAHSHLESNSIIPALLELYEEATENPEGAAAVDLKTRLEEVEMLPKLAKVESALQEKRTLDDSYSRLIALASRLWWLGLLHIVTEVLCVVGYVGFETQVRWAMISVFGALAVLSFCAMIWHMFLFDSQRTAFQACLRKNHGWP